MKQITKLQHFMELTLCPSCAKQFYNAHNTSIHRANYYQLERDICSYCGIRTGWDYIVSPVSAKGIFLPFLGKIEQYRRDQDNGAISDQ